MEPGLGGALAADTAGVAGAGGGGTTTATAGGMGVATGVGATAGAARAGAAGGVEVGAVYRELLALSIKDTLA